MRYVAVVLLSLVLASSAAAQQIWNQWGGGPTHNGFLSVHGQRLSKALVNIVVDPHAGLERSEAGGSLLVHYQTPLSDGQDVFMEVKSGTYTGFRTWGTQIWNVRKFQWEDDLLVERWTAPSDWTPPPYATGAPRFEPVFHGALTKDSIYMAGAEGTVLEINRQTGATTRRLGDFADFDTQTYVSSPITVDTQGNLYYNVVRLAVQTPWQSDVLGAWLVKVQPNGTHSRVSYSTLVPNAPSMCTGEFPGNQVPWPPTPDAQPASVPCGSQRPGINVAPAVAPDGTVYTVSRAHLNLRWGWLIAVNPNLTLKWSSSLRNRFNDGCNVLLPANGTPGGCRAGATTGVDPSDNQLGSGGVNDNSTSSPLVADGTVYYGTYTRYNYSQGHLVRFSAAGAFMSAYPFGWDITPAIWPHGGTFSVITKENRYVGIGSYCGGCASNRIASAPQGYYITQLSPTLQQEWQLKATNTESCVRQPNGSVTCSNDRPETFEWCVNSVAVDKRGVVYANSEDGNLYAINQGGTVRERIFLQLTLGAAYTPLSLGADGKIYTQNAGRLFVVGQETERRRVVRR